MKLICVNHYLNGFFGKSMREIIRLKTKSREKKQLLNAILDSTSGPVFAVDLDWNYLYYNYAHQQVVKKSRGHDVKPGDNYMQILRAHSDIDVQKAEAIKERVLAGEQFQALLEFGEPGLFRAWYETNYDTIKDRNGNVKGFVVLAQDVTERVRLQQELQNWNDFNEMLLSVLAHDLRQPFASIVTVVAHLKDTHQTLNEEELTMILFDLNDTAVKSIDILAGILHWIRSKKEGHQYKPELLPLKELLEEANALFVNDQQKKQISLNIDVPQELQVGGHRQMLLFIFRNLLSNAVKYSPSGETIRIYAYRSEKELIIAIEDKGSGMKPDQANNLFSMHGQIPLKGTAVKGAGIALAIAYDMVKQMNGNLRVDSALKRGTTLYLSLPDPT
jgi:signal transduction histidine kinase